MPDRDMTSRDMTELKAIDQGEQEAGSGLQATGLEALLDQLSMPAPVATKRRRGRPSRVPRPEEQLPNGS